MSKVDFLVKQAESIDGYSETFNRNMRNYTNALLSSEAFKGHGYKPQNGEFIHIPAIIYIGSVGVENSWREVFPTFCRYFMLQKAESELANAEFIQSEVLDRLNKGREVFHTIEASKKQMAQKKLDSLSYLLAVVTAGIELVKDMLNTVNGTNGLSLDRVTDPTVEIFINYYLQKA